MANLHNLPHSLRPYQAEIIEAILSTPGPVILEAPTGSGKTCIASAVSSQKKVVALCETKSLQIENYGKRYDFVVLMGKANYPCLYAPGRTAENCFFERTVSRCPQFRRCPYRVQKKAAQSSSRLSLNYSLWLQARWARGLKPSVLFLDEAHNVPEIVLSAFGCFVTPEQRRDLNFPPFPFLCDGQVDEAMDWLSRARVILSNVRRRRSDSRELFQMENQLLSALNALKECPEDWYIYSNPLGFTVQPLTARHFFRTLFPYPETLVAMSATIGNFRAFARELGMADYLALKVSNPWPAWSRPVHILDCPPLSRGTSTKEFEHQADAIARAIHACPPDWSGFIHVTRQSEAPALAERLARRGLADRVWVPPQGPTHTRMALWQARKRKQKGSLAITWDMWEGVDGLEERICIGAKVPFPDLSSRYETARLYYDPDMYRQRAAWKLEQGLGRTRRGRPEDYDDTEIRGFVAIADGNWEQIENYFSQSLREALVH